MQAIEELKKVREQLEETNKKLEKERDYIISLFKHMESVTQLNNK